MTKRLAYGLALLAAAHADGKTYAPEPQYKASHAAKVEVAPVPVCKDGSTYNPATGCSFVDYAEPKFDCPHPYKLEKQTGLCVTTTYGESQLICPAGSYIHGKKCISEVTAPPDVTCKKHDAILTEQGCLQRAAQEKVEDDITEPKLSCPHKYKLQGDICIAENHADAELVCEDGSQVQGKKCVTVDLVPPICDKGLTYSNGMCEGIEVVQPEGYCPKHTQELKGQCLQQVTAHPVQVCEKGYELSKKGKKCEARVLIQAVVDNKKGGAIDIDCKHGETDGKGNCFQTHYSDPVDVCDAGFTLEKKKCVSWVPVEQEYACPKHYDQNKDGSCVKRGAKKAKCPKGYKIDSKSGLCQAFIKEKPASICPKGTSSLQGSKHNSCTTVDYAEPLASCKKGYDLQGNICIKPGFVKAGKDKVTPPVYSCPKGFKLDKQKDVCVSLLEAQTEPVCQKGFTLEGHKCVAHHTTAPQGMCPKGFVNEGKGCVRVSYTRPIFECPKGAEDHGHKCFIYQETEPIIGAPQGTKGKRL